MNVEIDKDKKQKQQSKYNKLPDEEVVNYQNLIKEEYGRDIDFETAKVEAHKSMEIFLLSTLKDFSTLYR